MDRHPRSSMAEPPQLSSRSAYLMPAIKAMGQRSCSLVPSARERLRDATALHGVCILNRCLRVDLSTVLCLGSRAFDTDPAVGLSHSFAKLVLGMRKGETAVRREGAKVQSCQEFFDFVTLLSLVISSHLAHSESSSCSQRQLSSLPSCRLAVSLGKRPWVCY